MKRLMAGALAVAALTLSACGDQQQPPEVVTPSPLGTSSVAPSPTGSALANDPQSEAREVYALYSSELSRVLRGGGSDELTAALVETTSGNHQATTRRLIQMVKQRGLRSVGDPNLIIADVVIDNPNRVRVYTCEDATQSSWVDAEGRQVTLETAGFFETEIMMTRRDGGLQISEAATTKLERFADSERCRRAG